MDWRRTGLRRAGRIAGALAALFFLATFTPRREGPAPALPTGARMLAEAVPLDASDPQRRKVGALTFLGGWRLRSHDERFGGVSAIHVEGGEVLALSDAGTIFRFPAPEAAGELPLRIDRLQRGPGTGRRKSDRDAEALAVLGGRVWLVFEGMNQIWRYRRGDFAFEAAAAPQAMRRWPGNSGSEAMVRLRDGRFLVVAEGPVAADGTAPALLFPGDPTAAASRPLALRYRPPPGYAATDAAALPDGRIVFLNRRAALLEGFSAVVTVAEAPAAGSGAIIAGRELAALASPFTIDNMEALSITRENGRTILWIASDDNFTPLLQQTLLLKFALD